MGQWEGLRVCGISRTLDDDPGQALLCTNVSTRMYINLISCRRLNDACVCKDSEYLLLCSGKSSLADV